MVARTNYVIHMRPESPAFLRSLHPIRPCLCNSIHCISFVVMGEQCYVYCTFVILGTVIFSQ